MSVYQLANSTFWVQPIHSTSGKILGVELLTRFEQEGLYHVINPKYFIQQLPKEVKRELLLRQLLEVEEQADAFRNHDLFCTLNLNAEQAEILLADRFLQNIVMQLPFVRLEISEDFSGLNEGMNNPVLKGLIEKLNILWLDDLGAGNANMAAVVTQCYEAVKLDRKFYLQEIQKPSFPVLIENIRKYCDRVVVEGIEYIEELPILKEAGVWGVQGYLYKSVPLSKISSLL